ncbi:LysR family transcriptional activator of nhaA [Acidovorax delafieldii]|uniref:LysR family transcriptional activator of nhaA n=1 Tax=Acidovorax delafieldii TaxID=47920 RepID=A0AAJ2F6J8_ACIDE|nr:LysR family transcriptional regulator [Acidovorax delafieldii]MDR6156394.1 LysR family transcriptional activator of nhaA [Acidovorax delafieldii]MDR6769158.1 LysR family transcriptional activator of nhaA [Acidovorax delafieldii]MDR6839535.1 LysR family transcriptional activator of nhaA [Acidovorax delafieldii]MDR7369086.1 LysR family transcriptional activator of nhaA [Acidovorax delafieldii]
MSQSFNYRHLFYFWVVAKEGGIARAAERLDMAVQTISAQVRELEKSLGVSLLRTEGRNLVLTDAGVAALHEADHIFALGELLPVRVREAATGQTLRLNLGISDGIAKLAVHRLLTPVLDEPHLRLLCHEGEFQPLLGELALHKLDAVLADRAAPPNPALRTTSQLLGTSAIAWYAPPLWAEAAANNFPHSLAVVPVLLPTDHAAMRARIDHWLERERIRPHIAGEFEDSALLSTFAATGMGVMPAPVSLGEHLAQTHGLVQVGTAPDVQEQFHLIYSARKVMHPLLTRLLEAGQGGTLLN